VVVAPYPHAGEGLQPLRRVAEDMSTLSEPPDGVEFEEVEDGRVIARHLDSGVSSVGATEAEALRQLADALDSHFGRGETIDDPEQYLRDLGIDTEIGSEGPPPWLE
jgi:hypothetical protein